jgi:hypothetical protein
MSTTRKIKERPVAWLAADAGCEAPDHETSPGALLLTRVRDQMVRALEERPLKGLTSPDDDISVWRISDEAANHHIPTLWAQFVDLRAYREEPEDDHWPRDLNDVARVALGIVAARLCHSIIAECRQVEEPLLHVQAYEDEGD